MFTADCNSWYAQEYLLKPLLYESTKPKALCQRPLYWLVELLSAQQDEIATVKPDTTFTTWKYVLSCKKMPRQLLDEFQNAIFASNICHLEDDRATQATENGQYFISFISNLNPNFIEHLNLAQQSV